MSKRRRPTAHNSRPRDATQRSRQIQSKGISAIVRRAVDTAVDRVRQEPRLFGLGHLVWKLLFGGGIGALICLAVVFGTGKLPVPWVYMSNIVLAILVKLVASWFDTLFVTPRVQAMTTRAIKRWTGKSVPATAFSTLGNQNQTHMIVTVVVSCTALATVLVTQEVEPQRLTEPAMAIAAVATAGATIAAAEAVSNPSTIRALVRNRLPI